jgi:F-type H+-transporting ATPase subunit gamma
MEMVSATKMRRAQEVALLSRPYAVEALRILGELSARSPYQPALMASREVKTRLVVLVASDRGLAGAFNSNTFRKFASWLGSRKGEGAVHRFVAVGKKAEEFLSREGHVLEASFKGFGEHIEVQEVLPLTNLVVEGYRNGSWDEVVLIGTHFRTTLRQEVLTRTVLPISIENIRDTIREVVPEYGRYSGAIWGLNGEAAPHDFEYLVEPDPETVLDNLAPQLVEITLYQMILEANASEHSARMVAMKNASENAADLKDALTVEFNKSRQAGITREISEIVSGAEALSN